MKKTTPKPTTTADAASKLKTLPFFFDDIFTNYRKYRNHKRYVHIDLL